MDLGNLRIDFYIGQVWIDEMLVAAPNLLMSIFQNSIGTNSWQYFEKKHTTIMRLDTDLKWRNYRAESIILEFKQKCIQSVRIPFQPTHDPIYSVIDHPLTLLIESNLTDAKLIEVSKTEKKYSANFGDISITYDIRMLAIQLIISYHR